MRYYAWWYWAVRVCVSEAMECACECMYVILLSIFDLIKRLRLVDLHWFSIGIEWKLWWRWEQRATAAAAATWATLLTATIKYVEKNATQSNDHGIVIPQNANNSISLDDIDGNSHDGCIHFFCSLLLIWFGLGQWCGLRARAPYHNWHYNFPLRFGNWITT